MRVPWRREFDPDREFTVRKAITAGGRKFAAGETFDPTLVNTRRLRQLFDQHVIIFKGDTPGKLIREHRGYGASARAREAVAAEQAPPAAPPPPPPAPTQESDEEKAAREKAEARAAVVIPADWMDLAWNTVRGLAASLADEPIKDKATAQRVIAEEIARRAESS